MNERRSSLRLKMITAVITATAVSTGVVAAVASGAQATGEPPARPPTSSSVENGSGATTSYPIVSAGIVREVQASGDQISVGDRPVPAAQADRIVAEARARFGFTADASVVGVSYAHLTLPNYGRAAADGTVTTLVDDRPVLVVALGGVAVPIFGPGILPSGSDPTTQPSSYQADLLVFFDAGDEQFISAGTY